MRIKGDKSPEYYQNLWATMEILSAKMELLQECVVIISKNINRYKTIERVVGVPWEIISVLHMRESSFDFSCNLHNGEPLDHVTQLVPKGKGPFANWEESAVDALSMFKNSFPSIWDVRTSGYFIEAYNGFGYCNRGKHSPYLWSFSNNGVGSGKYVEDGKYSGEAVDGQCGCFPVIKLLMKQGFSSLFDVNPSKISLLSPEGPIIKLNTNYSMDVADMQSFMNRFFSRHGMSPKLKEDGVAGRKTSEAFKRIFGFYLMGDLRA